MIIKVHVDEIMRSHIKWLHQVLQVASISAYDSLVVTTKEVPWFVLRKFIFG